jgi:hypothetical protein
MEPPRKVIAASGLVSRRAAEKIIIERKLGEFQKINQKDTDLLYV